MNRPSNSPNEGCSIGLRIRERASEKGLPAETQADLIEALFADGITSKDEATEISGRGIGLGAVRAACRAFGGSVAVHTEAGRGTRFEFRFVLPSLLPPPGKQRSATTPLTEPD